MFIGKYYVMVLGGIFWVYYGIYIWYLCYLEEVVYLRFDIYGVKWYLVFGIYGMYSYQGIFYCVVFFLFIKYMSWYVVFGYRRFFVVVIE